MGGAVNYEVETVVTILQKNGGIADWEQLKARYIFSSNTPPRLYASGPRGVTVSIVSYAQNLEDVMLWRALRQVEKGFYIDVGANDPLIDSVTQVFYERGWHGINIEPLSEHFADLQRERPRDINLRCAAGSSEGEIEIWECDVRGWASVDRAAIEGHIAMGNIGRYHQVQMMPLAKICEQYAQQEIQFLKIDVEGFERSVLEGMDFRRFRPWIVVVEATRPNSTEEVHLQWESLLLGADYIFVYADGLNRFYLACEHGELAAKFQYPPNVFDDFVSSGQIEANIRAQAAEARAMQVEQRLAEIYKSASWKMTRPLRWFLRLAKNNLM